jgi:phosphoglycerate kinase
MNLTDHNDIDFRNKTIMIRTDYNVPLDNVYNNISDHTRIDKTIPTLKKIILKNPRLIILVSHLGRPDPSIYNNTLSLLPIKNYLSLKLNKKIHFLTDYFPNTDLSKFTGIVMLENIRFIKDEENYKPNNELSQYLSKYIDIYMNEAFSCCHRSHTSIVGVNAKYKIAGNLLFDEINHLIPVISKKNRKTLIVGGNKISDKIKLIENLIPEIDNLIIGGAMAFSFLKIINKLNIGKTLYYSNSEECVKRIKLLIRKYNVKLLLPIDWVIADSIKSSECLTINSNIPDDKMGLDIGTKTISLFNNVIDNISNDNIIVWNGPMGVFETKQYSYGTESIAKTLVSKKDTKIVIGGGDSTSALNKFVSQKDISIFLERNNHMSTAGGACLEFLEGKSLPGLTYLNNTL